MAGTTPTYGFPYPTASDTPAGHTQMQSLATAVENQLIVTDTNVAAARILSDVPVTANSSSTSGTGKVIWVSRQVTLVLNKRYEVVFDTGYDVATVSTIVFEMYYIAGSTATLTGATRFYERYQRGQTSGAFLQAHGDGSFVAPGNGTYTIMGALWNPDSAVSKTNSGTPNASDNRGRFIVKLG